MYNHLESLFIEVTINNERVIIGVLYRRPRSSFEDFMYDYRKILQELGDRKAYICGDFNLNLLQYETCNSVNTFVDLCFEYAYIPLINKPSRISSHSATAIDHIWHNRYDSAIECGILMSDTSDNFSPFVINIDSVENAESNESFFVYRNWKNMESEEFYNHVSEKMCDFYYNTNFDNIDASVDGIVGTLQNALNKFCPILKVNCSHDNDKHKPWLTNEIKSLIKEKK